MLSTPTASRRKGTEITYVSTCSPCPRSCSSTVATRSWRSPDCSTTLSRTPTTGTARRWPPRIRAAFGDRVADVVLGCSDTDEQPKPPWRLRKERYIAHLAEAPADVVLVSACDKLHNARCTVADLREYGADFWLGAASGVTFNAGPVTALVLRSAPLAVFRDLP